MNKIKNKMINRLYNISTLIIIIAMGLTACVKDLNVTPINPQLNTANVAYKDVNGYFQGLAKLYASFSLTGQQGPSGNGDLSSIPGSDEGNSGFYRVVFMAEESCTDEAIIGWGDPGIPQLRNIAFTAQDAFANYVYYRVMFGVGVCNQFLRDASDAELAKKGFSQSAIDSVKSFRQETRFIRALNYYYGLDCFRNMPFVTENSPLGAFSPPQATGIQLYNYLVGELKDLVDNNLLPTATDMNYGRATTAAAAALLAKLYLNAGVYTNPVGQVKSPTQSQLDSCIYYCNYIIGDTYHTLSQTSLGGSFTPYRELFMGDNGQNPNARKEFIFAVLFDNAQTKSYNGTDFLINASLGSGFDSTYLADYMGIIGGWGGIRVRPAFLTKSFGITASYPAITAPAPTTIGDNRALFYAKKGGSYTISDPAQYGQGYSPIKFSAHYASQAPTKGGSIFTSGFFDTDFPVFRIADIYLMRAEATLRGGNGSTNTATQDVNIIRNRANAGNATTTVDLQYVLDERARELYNECWRRSDLIRFGQFTSGYIWEFKGGDNYPNGIDVDAHYQVFPIPANEITANPNLKQNSGY